MSESPNDITGEAPIIDLANARQDAQPKLRIIRAKTCFCTFEIDGTAREITCPKCGRLWDPIDAWMHMARSWSNYSANRDSIKHEVARLSEVRDALQREVANLKAQVKRAKERLG